jgi:hypothetical protein
VEFRQRSYTLSQLVDIACSAVITQCLAHLAPERCEMTARHNTTSTLHVYKFAVATPVPFPARAIIKDIMMSLTRTTAQFN